MIEPGKCLMIRWLPLISALFLGLFTISCSPDSTELPIVPTPTPTESIYRPPTAVSIPDVDFPLLEGGELEGAAAGKYSGSTVAVGGAFTEDEIARLDSSLLKFVEATGIGIEYIRLPDIDKFPTGESGLEGDSDIALFSKPTVLRAYAASGNIVDLASWIPESWFSQQYGPSWIQMSRMEAPEGEITAGAWYLYEPKSLIWYPKDDFEARGYMVPKSWDALIQLSDQMVEEGERPWCVGLRNSQGPSFIATDWIEELLLRTAPVEAYDQWVAGELAFSSVDVENTFETLEEIWLAENYVLDGAAEIATTLFGAAVAPLFKSPPQCWFYYHDLGILDKFPDGVEPGLDYGFFPFPYLDPRTGNPTLVSSRIMAMLVDRPEVRALMEYFTLAESTSEFLMSGGGLSPHLAAGPDSYGVPFERALALQFASATTFRNDGSAQMPAVVGEGSFPAGVLDWIAGSAELQVILEEIDASWPR